MYAWDRETVFARLSWGARPETAVQVARRLRETVALLRQLVPGQPEALRYPDDLENPERWRRLVAEHVMRSDDGRPEPESGFTPCVDVEAADSSTAIAVQASAGGRIESISLPSNSLMVRFGPSTGPSPALPAGRHVQPVAIDLIRGLVSVWQPDVAGLTGRSANRAQLRLGPKRGATIGAVTWLSGRVFPAPDAVEGAVVTAYGEGTLLIVGSPEAPSIGAEAALAVRARLSEIAGAAAPVVQESPPPEVPALDVLPADAERDLPPSGAGAGSAPRAGAARRRDRAARPRGDVDLLADESTVVGRDRRRRSTGGVAPHPGRDAAGVAGRAQVGRDDHVPAVHEPGPFLTDGAGVRMPRMTP